MNDVSDNNVKCVKSNILSVDSMSLIDLFVGFNEIKAITFSNDSIFIDDIMKSFDTGKIILSGSSLIQKATKLQDLLAEICINAYEGKRTVKHYTVLTNHLSNGSIEFRTPGDVFYNTPIYLLKTNDGKTRVIRVFCNKDKTGDSKLIIDHYEYDDSIFCYDLYNTEFENVWNLSNVINIA